MLRRKHCSAKGHAIKTAVPYGSTKVEYLENTGTEFIEIKNLKFKVNDSFSTSSELKLSVIDTQRSEGRNGWGGDNRFYFWGITSGKWYAGNGYWGGSNVAADLDWHTLILRNSPTQDCYFYVDSTKVYKGTNLTTDWGAADTMGIWKTTEAQNRFLSLINKKRWWKIEKKFKNNPQINSSP